MAYKWTIENEVVRRLSDAAAIPVDPKNRDWRKCQAWVDEGNTIASADLPPDPPTAEEIYNAVIGSLDGTTTRVLRALVLALNDGSLPVGQSLSGTQIKAAITAKL